MDQDLPKIISKKLVVVGDSGVGKTTMLLAHSRGYFGEIFIPTIAELLWHDYEENGVVKMEMELIDTSNIQDYDRLRPLMYPNSSIALICFAINSPSSLVSAETKWRTEILKYIPKIPVFLIGCKSDLRNDEPTILDLQSRDERVVSVSDARRVADRIKAIHYFECLAATQTGLSNIFDTAAELVFNMQELKPNFLLCIII
ncbi:uncharacterized protein ASCRUDRAFT_72703 [Ascoidea rubescens DSM 1968]|uniref:Uncharacterized protein n=1 Tax=Ascoidea rubescens DSM 1968 TaxID=1344418 RepID=A0A1D2V9W0_9ASCO|nr:hypothetical protein ASCRUDRAFT_72703 [Ascoidea rubescens DSM 1968]ODV58287.1 hypothetical protein ASCRUDRAFT_72703 [Ascoidea rubescens DSM 1968]